MPCCKELQPLTETQQLYTECTFLTRAEVRRVDRLLKLLDADESGEVDALELRMLPELVYNPFGDRIVRFVDVDGSKALNRTELVDMFSMFSFQATSRAKAQIMFCIFDFDEDGELGLKDVKTVLQRMMLIPRESIKMGGRGSHRMISRLAMQKGSPEELLKRFEDNTSEWAAEIIKEVDTTGTGTITYDEWEENICAIDCFHDFATFKVASDASIARTAKRLESLKRRAHKRENKRVEKTNLRDQKNNGRSTQGTAGDMKFVNPIASETDEKQLEEGERDTSNDGTGGVDEPQGVMLLAPSGKMTPDQAATKIQAKARGRLQRDWAWAQKYPKDTLFEGGKIDLVELIGSPEFTDQLLHQLVPTKAEVGACIVDSGVTSEAMYIIASGKVGVSKDAGSEPFSYLSVGGVFGERAIITGMQTEAAYTASEGTGGSGTVKMFMLRKDKLFELLDANPEVRAQFLAPPEVRIAAKLRSLQERYSTSTFQATRPPPLQERMDFYIASEKQGPEAPSDGGEDPDENTDALDLLVKLPGVVLGTPKELIKEANRQVPEPTNRLWRGEIHHVESKFGRGVSTTFQLQRWIGAQNLRVAVVWIVMVIVPRQFAMYRYCDDSVEAVYQAGSIEAECSPKLSADNFGFIAAAFEDAADMQRAAFATSDEVSANRARNFYQHSAYAPAMGESFYLRHFTMAYTAAIIFIYWTTARSLLQKMHEVLSGLPVLGSGTESVSGLQSKTEGFFSVLAQYDFSVRHPSSVVNIQDGIYTHLEVLTESRKKTALKLTSKQILRQWFGWLMYIGLFGLCGMCIYLILSEDWIPDQCCACGCASCEGMLADLNMNANASQLNAGMDYNRTLHFNLTRAPEFCNDPEFECGSCKTGYRNPLMKYKESDSAASKLIQPMMLSVTTALIPLLTKQIRVVERRADIGDEMRVTLIRVFFLKMFNIGLMFADLVQVAANSKNVCLEDTVGELFRNMVFTDAFVYTFMTFLMYVRVKLRRGEKIEYNSIRAAQEAINVMYRQVITWVATVTSPAMPLITFIISNYLMALEFWALRHVFRPPERPWSAVKTVTSFMAMTLLTLLIATVPSTVWMTEIRRCGPFEGIRPIEAPGIFVRNLVANMTCLPPIDAELDEGFECAGLPRSACAPLEAVGQCEWRPQPLANYSVAFSWISTLVHIVTSLPFILSCLAATVAAIYFLDARLQRWEHEVAVLRETADGERKFLVKKLQKLHNTIHSLEGADTTDLTEVRSLAAIKKDLEELNDLKAEHYNGVGTMPTTATEYHSQHLETKGMSVKAELSHRKSKRAKRKERREVADRATTEKLLRYTE